MGKKILVAICLLIFGAAIAIFLQRTKPSKTSIPMHRGRVPRLSLEDFTMYKYNKHKIVSTLSGHFANFIDPDSLEMLGSIQGFNHQTPKKEFFSAELVKMQFAAKGLTELAKDSRIIKTEIETTAKFGYDEVVIYSDYAKFLHMEERLVSHVPVFVQGPQFDIKGEKGFEFNSGSGDLKVFGPLEGTMRGVEKLQK